MTPAPAPSQDVRRESERARTDPAIAPAGSLLGPAPHRRARWAGRGVPYLLFGIYLYCPEPRFQIWRLPAGHAPLPAGAGSATPLGGPAHRARVEPVSVRPLPPGRDPRYRDAAVGRAYALFELGRYAEALPHLERLPREGHGLQRPTAEVEEVRSRFAWTLYYSGHYSRARIDFTKGLAARPTWYGLHNGLGWTYLKLGDRAQAQASFQRAVQLKPDFVDARQGLAQVRR